MTRNRDRRRRLETQQRDPNREWVRRRYRAWCSCTSVTVAPSATIRVSSLYTILIGPWGSEKAVLKYPKWPARWWEAPGNRCIVITRLVPRDTISVYGGGMEWRPSRLNAMLFTLGPRSRRRSECSTAHFLESRALTNCRSSASTALSVDRPFLTSNWLSASSIPETATNP